MNEKGSPYILTKFKKGWHVSSIVRVDFGAYAKINQQSFVFDSNVFRSSEVVQHNILPCKF